jgi:hypothetical protein
MAGLVIRNGKLLLDATGGIVVRPDPTWNVATGLSPLLVAAPEGQAGAIAQFTASGGLPSSYTYSAVDALPSGLLLSSSGRLSGDGTEKVTAAADYTVRVSNAAGSTDFTVSIEIQASGAQTISYVDLVNEDTANPSSGFGYFAQPFVDGDVPSGKVPKLRRQSTGTVYDVQVSQRKMFPSGALEWGTICYRVPDIAAGATERYEIITASGSYDGTPTLGMSDLNATVGRDFKVEVSDREAISYATGSDSTGTQVPKGVQRDVTGDEDWGAAGSTNYIAAGSWASETRYHAAGGTVITLYDDNWGANTTRVWAIYPASGAGDITVTPAAGVTINGSSSPYVCTGYTLWHRSAAGTFVATVPTKPVVSLPDATCAFNTISTTSTRVTEQMAGPVCYMIRAWGMFGSDEHLKGEFFVTAYDDGAGGVAGWEFMPIMKLDWPIDGPFQGGQAKTRQVYEAVVKDGSTVLAEYNSNDWARVACQRVEHYYHSWWGGCDRTDDDLRMGQPHWIAGTKSRPTHWHKRDLAYLITTGKVAPYRDGIMTNTRTADDVWYPGITSLSQVTYRPCASQSHRGDMEQAGSYEGRGCLPAVDVEFLTNQTAQRWRVSTLANWSGLHAPVNIADHRTRTRPGGGSTDVANTLAPLLLDRDDASDSTTRWNSVGLADGVYFGRSDGSGTLPWNEPQGGKGAWTLEVSGQHAVQYSYAAALLSGRPWFIDSCMSNSFYVHTNSTSSGHKPPLYLAAYTGAPSTKWSGIAYYDGADRGVAWPLNVVATAAAVIPDDDPRSGFAKAHAAHEALYWARSLSYYPRELIDAGYVFYDVETSGGATEDFSFHIWQAAMGYLAYQYTGISDFKTIADQAAKLTIAALKGRGYAASWTYRGRSRPHSNEPWDLANLYSPVALLGERSTPQQIIADSDANTFYGADSNLGSYPLSNGDRLRWADANGSHTPNPPPTGITSGTDYYVVNAAGDGYWQISETPGGAPVDFGATSWPAFEMFSIRTMLDSAVMGEDGTRNLSSGNADQTPPMVWAMCVLAEKHGHPDADGTFMDGLETYVAPWLNFSNYGAQSWWVLERGL